MAKDLLVPPVLQAAVTDPPHPMLFLVYQQPAPIIVLETQQVTHHDKGQSYKTQKSSSRFGNMS